MKAIVALGILGIASLAIAQSDHNNLDKERPLTFEDAYSIAYRSYELQTGLSAFAFLNRRPQYGLRTEIQYGFAKNRDLSIGWDPVYDSGSARLRGNTLELSYFEGLSREIGNAPAIGYRIEMEAPTTGSARNADVRARLILSKRARTYDKFHLNLGAATTGKVAFGAILGYSLPLGYPNHFDTTFLAELGIEQSRMASGQNSWAGIGIRRQIDVTTVLDYSLRMRFGSAVSESRNLLTFTVGLSKSF